jgi:hypothetical protein
MAYIGRGTENISNVEVLDNLTFDGSASYTLQKSSTNFVPSSANNLLISISGVVQQGNFSVSGSTITFDTTVSASDTCDWILHYGTGLITTVADGAITEAKLGSNAVTTAKINNGAVTYAKTDGNFGKIGQVITDSDNANTVISSTTYTDTGLTASITPSSTSSKILVLVSQDYHIETTTSTNAAMGGFKVLRDSTTLHTGADDGNSFGIRFASGLDNNKVYNNNWHFSIVDSPSSTSSITYKTQARTYNTNSRFRLNNQINGTCISTITLMEVLA